MKHNISFQNFVIGEKQNIKTIPLNRKNIQIQIAINSDNIAYKNKYFILNLDIQTVYIGTTMTGIQIPIILNHPHKHTGDDIKYFAYRYHGRQFIYGLVNSLNMFGRRIDHGNIEILRYDISHHEHTVYDIKVEDLNIEDIDRILYPNEFYNKPFYKYVRSGNKYYVNKLKTT